MLLYFIPKFLFDAVIISTIFFSSKHYVCSVDPSGEVIVIFYGRDTFIGAVTYTGAVFSSGGLSAADPTFYGSFTIIACNRFVTFAYATVVPYLNLLF